MSKTLRLSEKWFHRGLWLVAIVFASFLIGLGNTVIRNLPKVEHRYALEDFLDQKTVDPIRNELKITQRKEQEANEALEQAQLKFSSAQADYRAARETLNNWLAARRVTERGDQNPEVIARTKTLDTLKSAERSAFAIVQAQQKAGLDARQNVRRLQTQINELEQTANQRYIEELRRQDLRVFLYRLALTLPLLIIAGWLFKTKRQSTYWPFVWGFIFFALFAFFVELVPYLPDYGGYIRYIVGIVVTVVVGRQVILALNRYLQRQKLVEQLPEVQRREEVSYDLALARFAKNVCPGCERAVNLADPSIDFCPHCGISLYNHCTQCNTRKGAFAKFCHTCGTAAVR